MPRQLPLKDVHGWNAEQPPICAHAGCCVKQQVQACVRAALSLLVTGLSCRGTRWLGAVAAQPLRCRQAALAVELTIASSMRLCRRFNLGAFLPPSPPPHATPGGAASSPSRTLPPPAVAQKGSAGTAGDGGSEDSDEDAEPQPQPYTPAAAVAAGGGAAGGAGVSRQASYCSEANRPLLLPPLGGDPQAALNKLSQALRF